jgi:4-hydroxyacetophenone monooxygenase
MVVDSAFIRRGVEAADLNAVRVTMYHLTGDPKIEALPMAAKMTPEERAFLIDTAVAWLEKNHGPKELPPPSREELRKLMNLATKETMPDLEFEARRGLPGFEEFPWTATWTKGKPQVPEGFKVAIIGGGFSGVATALQMKLLGIPFVLFERRPEPGGVWSVNRYPDVRVDTSSMAYDFNFERDWRWSEYYARGPEVRRYIEHVAKKHGILPHMRFNRDVISATFDEKRNIWTVTAKGPNGEESVEANVIVACTGTFLNPRFPRFENHDAFKGPILHPARWPDDFDPTGKNVAVLGNGSTGVQLLAPIAEKAKQVYVYQRTPQWISTRPGYGKSLEPEVSWLLDNFPRFWHWSRYMTSANAFFTHDLLVADDEYHAKGGGLNKHQDELRKNILAFMSSQLGHRQDLLPKLTPNYTAFARRAVVDNNWYKSLTRDNVELVTEGIKRLTSKGIETVDGKEREVDIIVTATGYHVSQYLAPTKYKGKGGIDIHEMWNAGDGARAYIGMMAPNFPNMFMVYGPNSQPVSGGTMLPVWFVIWAAYAGQCIVRMLEEGKSRVEVKQEAYDRYNREMDEEGKKLILLREGAAPEKNYYVSGDRLSVNAPWYGPDFHRMSTEVKWDDLIIS